MTAQLGKLESELSAELAWRKKEIVGLRGSTRRPSAVQAFVCRAGAVVLCAHWEGYLRSSIQFYINHVFEQKIIIKSLSPAFVAICFYNDIKAAAQAEYPGSEQHCIKFSKRILQGIDIHAPKPKWKVETGGNPTSNVVVRLLRTAGLDERLGLSEAEWAATKAFIDEQLLKDRNMIAHGEGLPVDSSEFRSRASRVISICEALTELVLNAAVNRIYLTQVSPVENIGHGATAQ